MDDICGEYGLLVSVNVMPMNNIKRSKGLLGLHPHLTLGTVLFQSPLICFQLNGLLFIFVIFIHVLYVQLSAL